MNIASIQSGHWTDDELLGFIYGIGPSGNHLKGCSDCQARLAAMQVNRASIEENFPIGDRVSASLLASQRRRIYQRLEQPVRWWSGLPMKRWAAGVTSALVLGGSLFIYQQNQYQQSQYQQNQAEQRGRDSISDAKLAQEVAAMAQDNDTGVSSMAPLEGLFE